MRAARLAPTPVGRVVVVVAILLLAAVASGITLLAVSAVFDGIDAEWSEVGAAVLGSFAVAGAALGLAAPLGVGLAVWVQWLAAPSLAERAGRVLLALGAVPPVAYAVVGLMLPVWWSPLAAALALAMVAMPAIAGSALRAVREVPRGALLQGVALGATWSQAVAGIGLPAAGEGLLRAVALGFGRAVADTMIVLLLLGAAGIPEQSLPGLVIVRAASGVGPALAVPALLLGAISVALVVIGRRRVSR